MGGYERKWEWVNWRWYKNISNKNLFANDPSFFGGKASVSNGGAESFMGVFNAEIGGGTRPIFIFLGDSTNVKADVQQILSYAREAYR